MTRKLLLVVTLAAMALSTGFAGTAGAEVKLTYSTFFPPTHIQSQLAEEWCAEVEKRTGGEVEVEFYPGQTLTSAPDTYGGVVDGIADVGFSVLAYSRGRFPVMAAVDLPLGYESGVAATKVANAVYEKFDPAEFDDTEVMYFHAHGPGLPHTKGEPIKKMEDMKGLKLRATGNSAKVVKALGGTPVAQSMPEAYQSIQKGVVDGGMYPIETNKGWKMAEVVDYCTEAYSVAYTTTFFVVMNKAKWKSLSDDAKDAIREINEEWSVKHGEAWDESDKAGREFFLEQGGEFIPLSDAEAELWKAEVTPILAEYVAEAGKKGLPGQEIVDFTVETLNSMQ
jgi:TRAP-type C4-dicarboxylate transport system substrate-binding protein